MASYRDRVIQASNAIRYARDLNAMIRRFDRDIERATNDDDRDYLTVFRDGFRRELAAIVIICAYDESKEQRAIQSQRLHDGAAR